MTVSFARIPTKFAGQYLAWFANDWWWNSVSIVRDDAHALIPLPFGTCELLVADGYLEITINASSLSNAALLEDAVSERLDGFAGGEELQYHWITAPTRDAIA
jgi:hypothetical protein